MLGNRELVLDTFCEVHDLLKHWMDFEFWDFANHTPVKDGIYLLGRQQFKENITQIRELVEKKYCHIILSNPHEGSSTFLAQCQQFGIMDLIEQNKILLIGGGEMESNIPCLQYDSFIPKLFDYKENIESSKHWEEIFLKNNKPYKFLFLNSRQRPSRKYLLEKFKLSGLLDQSLWTSLISSRAMVPWPDRVDLSIWHNGEDLMKIIRPIKYLPPDYEVTQFKNHTTQQILSPNVTGKDQLFNGVWGEIYLTPEPYIDTYFSLVTETVFEYTHSFRTEKIWKPIAMGHPWIAVANPGYYRDIQNLGFKTFGHVIDESFDSIQNHRDRLDRIVEVVEDLCQQDLAKFLNECYTVCKYNQQHLAEMRTKVRQEFPDRFFQFVKKYINE